jgi:hypothetical protein
MTHKPARTFLALSATVLLGVVAFAADPGVDLPNDPSLRSVSQVGDQKKGSLLIYNFYSSSPSAGGVNNTRISITNTNPVALSLVHVFFVDGGSCGVADAYLCLTPNQTASFQTSDVDPGIAGYIVVIASDENGLPARFDWLIGDEYIKLDSGHIANLGAEAVSVPVNDQPFVNVPGSNQSVVDIVFDGEHYSRLPRVLAASNISSRADGNEALLVINRIGGNLGTSAGTIGNLFGILYDDGENGFSWTATVTTCQLRTLITNNFPRTTPRLEVAIPAGRTGWLKVYAASTVDQTPIGGVADSRAILGAILTRNPNAGVAANAFNGGRNLHKLTLNPITVARVPVFPPNC